MKKICAVVVTYNRKEMLCDTIHAILKQSFPVEKLVIADNQSTDGTYQYLVKNNIIADRRIRYVRLKTNMGGAGGFHYGMKIAMEAAPDAIWIMDDDVIPGEDCLEELIHAHRKIDEEVSFLASAVRGPNGEAMNVPKQMKESVSSYVDWYRYLESGIVKIRKATFVSLLINAAAVKKCGYPWKDFFIWGDDSEYTQRLIRDYGPAYMVGKSHAIHMRKGSDALSLVKEDNKERIPLYYYYYRNNLIGYWEYEGWLYRFLCMGKLWLDMILVLVRSSCYKKKKVQTIWRAFFDFVFGRYDKKSFKTRNRIGNKV